MFYAEGLRGVSDERITSSWMNNVRLLGAFTEAHTNISYDNPVHGLEALSDLLEKEDREDAAEVAHLTLHEWFNIFQTADSPKKSLMVFKYLWQIGRIDGKKDPEFASFSAEELNNVQFVDHNDTPLDGDYQGQMFG